MTAEEFDKEFTFVNNSMKQDLVEYNKHLKENDKLSIEDTHEKIRSILIDYGSQEYGDCIIDEICQLFNFPTTIDIEPEEEEEE